MSSETVSIEVTACTWVRRLAVEVPAPPVGRHSEGQCTGLREGGVQIARSIGVTDGEVVEPENVHQFNVHSSADGFLQHHT